MRGIDIALFDFKTYIAILNGQYTSENAELITGILRNEWGGWWIGNNRLVQHIRSY